MPRTCFVIMPFSSTQSCTEQEWTSIFEALLKPAVESAGLDYECRRSEATRGNIVGRIVQDLNESYVVLADFTDRNPNVFYELGVRHALNNRSIILAQKRDDIPFDLRAYAYHVYGWKTEADRRLLTDKLQQLLREIDTNPQRPDNPVSDFLRVSAQPAVIIPEPATAISPQEARIAQPLVGSGAEGLNVDQSTRQLAKSGPPSAARTIYRLTKPELLSKVSEAVAELNRRTGRGSVQPSEIPSLAREFIALGEPYIVPIEIFALASIEEGWTDGLRQLLSFAGDLITLSESRGSGTFIRFAVGLPALLGFRSLVVAGSKAVAEEQFAIVDLLVNHPIEVEKSGGQFTHRALVERRNLFYSEAFLGYANHTMDYVKDLWHTQGDLRRYFESQEVYHFFLAQFLIIVALAEAAKTDGSHVLYPGYRLVPQSARAMSAFCGRVNRLPLYRDAIAKVVLGENGDALKAKWESLAAKANSAHWNDFDNPWPTLFPTTLHGAEQQ